MVDWKPNLSLHGSLYSVFCFISLWAKIILWWKLMLPNSFGVFIQTTPFVNQPFEAYWWIGNKTNKEDCPIRSWRCYSKKQVLVCIQKSKSLEMVVSVLCMYFKSFLMDWFPTFGYPNMVFPSMCYSKSSHFINKYLDWCVVSILCGWLI
jgi:hypothetical protein